MPASRIVVLSRLGSRRSAKLLGAVGRLRLSVDLGDGAALEALAGSIASIMAAQKGERAAV